jgi:hypothetical protein
VEAHPGAVKAPPGAVKAPPGAMEAPPGAMEAPPGAVEAPLLFKNTSKKAKQQECFSTEKYCYLPDPNYRTIFLNPKILNNIHHAY